MAPGAGAGRLTRPPPDRPARAPTRVCLAGTATRLGRALADGGRALADEHLVAVIAVSSPGQDDRLLLEELRQTADRHDVAFLVADDAGLAGELMADGVEIDWDQEKYAAARARLRADRAVGCRVGTSRHRAMQAAESGADYVRFVPASSGRGDVDVMIEICKWWAEIFEVPCFAGAIGDRGAIAALCRAGVDFVVIDEDVPETVAGLLAAVAADQDVDSG